MTTVDTMDTMPQWQRALVERRREERRKLEDMPAWKRELIHKKRLADNFTNHDTQPKSMKTAYVSDIDQVDYNYQIDQDNVNCVNGHNKDVNMQLIGSDSNDDSHLDGLYTENDTMSSLSQNPFIRSYGLKLQRKNSSERIIYDEPLNGSFDYNSSFDDDYIGDYHPGSGFVHKLLDRFSSLSAKENTQNDYLRRRGLRSKARSSSVDRYSSSSPEKRRSSELSPSRKLSNEYIVSRKLSNEHIQSRKSSNELQSNKRLSDTIGPLFLNSSHEDRPIHTNDSPLSPTGRRTSFNTDMKLARDDLVIIEKTPESLNDSANLSFTITCETTRPPIDELPKPNTVSSFRDLFESGINKNRETVKKATVEESITFPNVRSRQDSFTSTESIPNSDAITSPAHTDVDEVKSDSLNVSVDEVLSINKDDSTDDLTEDEPVILRRDTENDNKSELYDSIRSKLRHVRISAEAEELRYSWREGMEIHVDDCKSPVMSPTRLLSPTRTVRHSLTSDVTVTQSPRTHEAPDINDNSCSNIVSKRHDQKSDIVSVSSEPQPIPRKSKYPKSTVTDSTIKTDKVEPLQSETISHEKDFITNIDSVVLPQEVTPNKIVTTVDIHSTIPDIAKPVNDVVQITQIDLDEVDRTPVKSTVKSTVKSPIATSSPSKHSTEKQPLQRLAKTNDSPSAKVKFTPPTSTSESPTKMVNVKHKSSPILVQPTNRFVDVNNDANKPGFLDAGKSMFFQSGQFQANPEPRRVAKRKPPQQKTTGNVTVINLTNDMLIHGHSPDIQRKDIPITNIDDAIPSNMIPLLDLSDITNESDDDYQEGYIPTEIKPCPYVFEGAGVVLGKSSLGKRGGSRLKIQFDDTATVTYEYPSEEWMREEIHDTQPSTNGPSVNLSTGCLMLSGFEDAGETRDHEPIRYIDDDDDGQHSLGKVSALPNAMGGLSSYKSRFTEDYQFGQEFERQAARDQEREAIQGREQNQSPMDEELQLRQADEDDMATFSHTSSASDILF